jgi:DNA repair protein RecN (Recombination protein N)
MLHHLRVQNLVLIDEMTLELAPGFNVMTGETGAGKSMVIGALGLVLGGRASPEIVRAGKKEAEVEALFEVSANARVLELLRASGIPSDGELVVRRVVSEHRSRAFINGKLCTAAELRVLGSELCDVSSQHESVSLTDASTHGAYLDAFGELRDASKELEESVQVLFQIEGDLSARREAAARVREREDYLRFQLKELDDLAPVEGEEVLLDQERGRLRHSEKLSTVTRAASERLYESEASVCDVLGQVISDLGVTLELDGTLTPLARRVSDARAELADVARELERYSGSVESDPARLDVVEERLFRLQKLLLKHGPGTKELVLLRHELSRSLDELEGTDEALAALDRRREEAFQRVAKQARSLSKQRRDAAEHLADAIGRELQHLGMGRARVVVEVRPLASVEGGLSLDGARLTASGIDHVEFLIAPNRGEEPRPLRRIASGGELSRALLALKRVLAENAPRGTYVFDEVDTGVGGAVAEVIGRSMAQVAHHRQVLCITHLPQIAALAEHHFVVEKIEEKERTRAGLKKLKDSERVLEIARMLGGARVTESTKKTASELLQVGKHLRQQPATRAPQKGLRSP